MLLLFLNITKIIKEVYKKNLQYNVPFTVDS
jgi:hypothetical protein